MSEINSIVIVGAGAAGLMAARELAKAGKKVVILEGRDRCGGRVSSLPSEEFGYAADGGAEFVHGEAKLTRALISSAGLHYLPIVGAAWRYENGELVKGHRDSPDMDLFIRKLADLNIDVSVAAFLEEHFSEERYADLKKAILGLVKGYDAADPARASAFALREELSEENGRGQQGRVKEGYGALIDFLESECRRYGCEIELNCRVIAIEHQGERKIHCAAGRTFTPERVILTISLPLILQTAFTPEIPRKMAAVREIGYGNVIKIVIQFRSRWWIRTCRQDFARLTFLFSNEVIPTWWTQFPEAYATLTGWIGGPNTEPFKGMSPQEIVNTAFRVLSTVFKTPEQTIRESCIAARVLDWSVDPFAQGAYSYVTVGTKDARRELLTPINDFVFFAGEALADGATASTVEAALVSGRDVARCIVAA